MKIWLNMDDSGAQVWGSFEEPEWAPRRKMWIANDQHIMCEDWVLLLGADQIFDEQGPVCYCYDLSGKKPKLVGVWDAVR